MGNLKLGLALKSDISYGFGRAAVLVVVLVHLPLNALEQRMWRGWSSRGGGSPMESVWPGHALTIHDVLLLHQYPGYVL